MAFTNTWDTTFPPDTQLANLLGADLRNFRLDTQQRMSSISGLDAAKPPFQTDAQPNNWNGILFFATDTGRIYQFNNPSWTDVTASFVGSSQILSLAHICAPSTIAAANTAFHTLQTFNYTANSWNSANRQIRITAGFQANRFNNSTVNLQLSFLGVAFPLGTLAAASSAAQFFIDVIMGVATTGAAGVVNASVFSLGADGINFLTNPVGGGNSATVNWTVGGTVLLQASYGTANASNQFTTGTWTVLQLN